MKFNKDILGAFFSSVCLLHCLMGPVLLLLGVSTVGLAFLENEWIHYALCVPILVFVIWSIPLGYKSHHNKIPPFFALVGVVLFVFGLVSSEKFEVIFTVVASIFLVSAHLYNRHLLIGQKCISGKKVVA